MEPDKIVLRSDVERADPWQIAQEVQAASALVGNRSQALERLLKYYQRLSVGTDGYVPMPEDRTRSARFEIMRNIHNAFRAMSMQDVLISDLRRELRIVTDARRELADPLMLRDVQTLLDAHSHRSHEIDEALDPIAVRHVRDKLARLLTNVGVALITADGHSDGRHT